MRINQNGNIGIGTSVPLSKLHTYSNTTNVGMISEVSHTTDWKFGIISAVNRGKTKALPVLLRDSKGATTDAFAVLGNGSVYAKELTLNVPIFADYVFDKDYHLMPLSDLGKYIKKHKHLPNMPTEKEVLEKGLSIGDLQIKQTEKIEELTLYIIEQEEKIKEQEKRLARLEKLIKKIKTLKR